MSAWDRVARVYDLQLPLERAALGAALDLAAIRGEDRLLDLATGTGALLRALADRPQAPCEAVGVDASSQMLAVAPPLPPGWRLLQAAATELPCGDASFDAATAAYLLHVLERSARRVVIAELRRTLRPGGRLVTVTVVKPRSRLARSAFAPIARGATRRSGIMSGWRALDPRPELIEGGFSVLRSRYCARGYPSLVVLSERKR